VARLKRRARKKRNTPEVIAIVLRATLSACTMRNVSLAAGLQVLHRVAKPTDARCFREEGIVMARKHFRDYAPLYGRGGVSWPFGKPP